MAYGAIIGQTPTVQASAEMTSYNNDNTSSVITADNVQGAIDQLFTSVSNGKSQIASAITGMGVSTSANDSFAQMATNIGNIETGYDTSQVTATAATVRSGYKFVNSSGQLITGTIPSKGAQTYTPRTVSQTIAKGQYLSGNQTIQGDGNLKGDYIKRGISIFGVSGFYDYNRVWVNNMFTQIGTGESQVLRINLDKSFSGSEGIRGFIQFSLQDSYETGVIITIEGLSYGVSDIHNVNILYTGSSTFYRVRGQLHSTYIDLDIGDMFNNFYINPETYRFLDDFLVKYN